MIIVSPATGEMIKLSEVKHPIFRDQVMGSGVAINPSSNLICAPISGKVITIYPTKHAFCIKNKEGVSVLIHIGIETGRLEGKFFKTNVKRGDDVLINEPLIEVNFDEIEKLGYKTTIMITVLNASYYDTVSIIGQSHVKQTEVIIKLK